MAQTKQTPTAPQTAQQTQRPAPAPAQKSAPEPQTPILFRDFASI